MYNPNNRYRCTIIRGKAQTQVEDLAPIYAQAIINCEGYNKDIFNQCFDEYLAGYLASPTSKTLANHRTEIAGKLFGMYYFKNNTVVVPKRTYQVVEDEDLPRFFKAIVWNFQFPNGMDASSTTKERLENSISIRPFHFIVALLKKAEENNIQLTKTEVAYYILDSKDVLQGIATPTEVLDAIVADRHSGTYNKVEYPSKASSYGMQHISEQLNLLELSNVITQVTEGHEKFISLNNKESFFVQKMLDEDYASPLFDIYPFYSSEQVQPLLAEKWGEYFSSLPSDFDVPETKTFTLKTGEPVETLQPAPVSDSPLDIGDEGERIVFEREKERVKAFNPRLSQQRVLLLGKQRGLGYDIQSVWADWKDQFNKREDGTFFIEVKSTRRITPPSLGVADKVVLTRNEWLAAEQHKECYSIFRIYLTRSGVYAYKIFNPLNNKHGFCSAIKYNYEFSVAEGVERWQ